MTRPVSKPRIPLGISACLLGENVRYDGGNRLERALIERLAVCCEFRAICPEVAIGLGVPRAPIRLEHSAGGLRVRGVEEPDLDVTRALRDLGTRSAVELGGICGYVFKARSPSCGPRGVKTFSADGAPRDPTGIGAYAAAIIAVFPDLPVADETSLSEAAATQDFIDRVRAYHAR